VRQFARYIFNVIIKVAERISRWSRLRAHTWRIGVNFSRQVARISWKLPR